VKKLTYLRGGGHFAPIVVVRTRGAHEFDVPAPRTAAEIVLTEVLRGIAASYHAERKRSLRRRRLVIMPVPKRSHSMNAAKGGQTYPSSVATRCSCQSDRCSPRTGGRKDSRPGMGGL